MIICNAVYVTGAEKGVGEGTAVVGVAARTVAVGDGIGDSVGVADGVAAAGLGPGMARELIPQPEARQAKTIMLRSSATFRVTMPIYLPIY